MKRKLKKAGILLTIFFAAVVVYFMAAQNTMEKEATVYSSMAEPTLPVVYADFGGQQINCLHGYMDDMGNQAARDSITVLPENRMLRLRIEEYGNTISGISYEIRNLSLDRLVEETTVGQWSSNKGSTTVDLPIQNLLVKEEPYLLKLIVATGEKTINYYTRILWSDQNYAQDMVQLAKDFSEKSLDYDQARELVTYLETSSTEDNSSLGQATLKSSFEHLTWDRLPVKMLAQPEITMKELEGSLGSVQVKYQVSLTEEKGNTHILDVEDYYTMRWGEQRIYMMDFQRRANQVFTEDQASFTGKGIELGISNDDSVGTVKSPDAHYTVFKSNRELWRYDQKGNKMLRLFSFKTTGNDSGIRNRYDQHDIRILSAEDNGDVNFLVYGYMNRGEYEGRMGVALYSYREDRDTLEEQFFIPAARSFQLIKKDIGQLAYLSGSNMTYLLLDGTVYGIDLKSGESMVVAQGLTAGTYGVSEDQSRIAWQEGSDVFRSPRLHVMDLETSKKQEIAGKVDDYIRVLGFIGNDLVYGLGTENDMWIVDGRIQELPMYAVFVMGEDMTVATRYQKDEIYVSDVSVEDGRIHMKCLKKRTGQDYVFQNEDTIVCNEQVSKNPLEGIGWYASQEKGKVYFVETDHGAGSETVTFHNPSKFSIEDTANLDAAVNYQNSQEVIFYAYAGGRLQGITRNFKEAVDLVYDQMGVITDQNQHMVWNRINRRNTVSIRDGAAAAGRVLRSLEDFNGSHLCEGGLLLTDARGCSLNQVLYFIDKEVPVIAYTSSDAYVYLTGYDAYNVTIYDPATQTSEKMGLNDAAAYFETRGNDFLCGKYVQ